MPSHTAAVHGRFRVAIAAMLFSTLVAACGDATVLSVTGESPSAADMSTLSTISRAAESSRPADRLRPTGRLGIFVPRIANGTIRSTPAQIIAEAGALAVGTVRAEQDITNPLADDVAAFTAAGLDVVLTLRNGPQLAETGKPTVYPPHTTEELAVFRANLDRILGATSPILLAVENEEVGSPFVSGTAGDYLAELAAAIEVGHAHGVPVTNGGIVSGIAAVLTWQDIFATQSKVAADDFARRAFPRPIETHTLTTLLASPDGALPPGELTDRVAKGRELIDAYATLPLDYVNFHWYIDDDAALVQTVEYLRRATGKPVITHEIGQYTIDPAVVTGHLDTLARLGMPFVIWFDADGVPAFGLHDAPAVLRPTGAAFAIAPGWLRPD
jgi:hypothetical protein